MHVLFKSYFTWLCVGGLGIPGVEIVASEQEETRCLQLYVVLGVAEFELFEGDKY